MPVIKTSWLEVISLITHVVFYLSLRWYSLKSKPGKKDEKYRGEIEVKVTFIVQSKSDSQSSLKISRAGSIKHLASTVGRLFSHKNTKIPLYW